MQHSISRVNCTLMRGIISHLGWKWRVIWIAHGIIRCANMASASNFGWEFDASASQVCESIIFNTRREQLRNLLSLSDPNLLIIVY